MLIRSAFYSRNWHNRVEEVGSMKCCSRTKTYQDVGGGGGRWQGVVSCESGTSVTENVEPSGIMKTFTLNV